MDDHEPTERREHSNQARAYGRVFPRRRLLKGGAALAALGAGVATLGSGERAGADLGRRTPQAYLPQVARDGSPADAPRDVTTLRGCADALGLKIGVMGDVGDIEWWSPPGRCAEACQANETYRIQKTQFNSVFLTSISISEVLRESQYAYDFRKPDFYADMAIQNNQHIRGDFLVYGLDSDIIPFRDLPDWLHNSKWTRQEYISFMQEHITTVMTHFKGRIKEWSVVNEPTVKDPNYQLFWRRKIGPEYVQLAFEAAREADPEATLLLNDSGGDYKGAAYSEEILALVRDLKAKGLVDEVGMEMHVGSGHSNIDPLHPPAREGIIDQMKRYQDVGVDVVVTELDVVANRFPGTVEDQRRAQADAYRFIIEAVVESGGACRSVTFYTLNDEYSWSTDGAVALYSHNKPKPAYYAVLKALQDAVARGGVS